MRARGPGGSLDGLTKTKIKELGSKLRFYPGVPDCFETLKAEIEGDPRFRQVGIRLECYAVTGGIEELLKASPLEPVMHDIWGCSFEYDSDERPIAPKRVVSFTDKTRFLFMIQKGKVGEEFRNQPYVVNEPMESSERPIPFSNMIYLRDGASDIPAMSLLLAAQGFVIGVLSKSKPYRTWALGYGRRANVTVPPEYESEGYAYALLKQAATEIAERIRHNLTGPGPIPGF